MAVRMLPFVFSRSRPFDGGAGIGIDRSDGLLLFRRPRLSIGLSRTIAAGCQTDSQASCSYQCDDFLFIHDEPLSLLHT